MKILINNQFYDSDTCNISANDRGLLFGDGIFTTIKSINNKLQHFHQHYERLKQHAKTTSITIKLSEKELHDNCIELLKQNQQCQKTAITRITITRGISERGINIPKQPIPTVIIQCTNLEPKSDLTPIRICYTSIVRNEYSPLTRIKSLNYLESILARKEAQERNFDDGIMLNTRGSICECTAANIFFVTTNYEVLTPHLSEGVLNGIIREQVIATCKKLNIPILQRSICPDDIYDCIEAFQTNCVIDIQPISHIEDFNFSVKNDGITQLIGNYYCNSK
ncbi:MAG: aminotransferase class IV [Burkholderiales bacterium]|nr:aminotransferase class IV [Burkholderiales bacterium]